MQGNVFLAATDPAAHFLGAQAQNVLATENVLLPFSIGAGMHARAVIRHLTIVSVQQLAWEVAFFGRSTFHNALVGPNSFLARFRFSSSEGVQYGSGPYCYHAANIDLPYADRDIDQGPQRGGQLHLLLTNRSPVAKSAGADGAIQIVCFMEPTLG